LVSFSVFSPSLSNGGAIKLTIIGQDLAGNTFWEFKDVMNAARFRRIVRFDPKTHFSDVQVTREFCRIQLQTGLERDHLFFSAKKEFDNER
jgi:hypothetical protein